MKTYLTIVSMCFLVQFGFGQEEHHHAHKSLLDQLNLITDPSCEKLAVGGNSHSPMGWQITPKTGRSVRDTQDGGDAACFNAAGFEVTTAQATEGGFFYGDVGGTQLTELSQTVDLLQDRKDEQFFYAYQYRMADDKQRLSHTVDVVIEYLDARNEVISQLNERTNFTHRAADQKYVIKSGTSTAPAGTRKIKWTVRWKNNGTERNKIILDDFWLAYNDPQRHCITGLHGLPYVCLSDPHLLSGDEISMTCDDFFDDEYINSLIIIDETRACDTDGTVKIKRPGGNNGGSGELADMDFSRKLVFEFNSPSDFCGQNTLTLDVNVTGECPDPSFVKEVLPAVTVPCGYDLENDPDNIIGTPTGIGSFEHSNEDIGNPNECGGQVIRTWEAATNGGFITKEQIINIGVLTIFQKKAYAGRVMAFQEGYIHTDNRLNITDSDLTDFNIIRSLQLAPGYQVTVYNNIFSAFSGGPTFGTDKADFNIPIGGRTPIPSNKIEALEVTKVGEEVSAVLYQNTNYAGDYQSFIGETEVDIIDLENSNSGRNTSTSTRRSIRLRPNYKLVVYAEANFEGDSTIYNSTGTIGGEIGSLKIIKK